ncbi:TetR/AcrR family transcriptional regulator [Herbiconiux daphne]|uniref:TetR/AcrR family transcriptional regulator n=1 Tax=Herbiconiux daphne TaxID=2970914 RepID=A0ABT2H4E2_9MICO|nr:TetR/AcrR family transcriptional regulator [Herbiconiux daphne]MCS5734788.1 TetR/AcrR family transcriptional regulator [Herbiconiux daphne]
MARTRRFDEQSLLDCAQEIFWVRGYDRTSIEEVSAASGVGNGSIYAAYGSKLGLFLAVFGRYCDGRVALVDNVIRSHEGSFEEAVANYLDEIVADCTSHADRRGCLMVNSLTELATRFPDVLAIGTRAVSRMDEIVGARVASAVAAGELELAPDEIEPLGAQIVLVSQGLIQLSRTGATPERLRSIAAAATTRAAVRAA